MGTEEYSANLRRSIRQLQERAAVKTGLKALPKRGAITAKVQIGKRTASGTGVSSPITETAGSREYHPTVRSMTSSDGLFVIEYQAVWKISTVDGDGKAILFVYDDV
jgi:hypothetical protein